MRAKQSLGGNLRRIFGRQIDGALAAAKGEKENGSLVHAVRKHLKKARAILHLVRKEIGRGQFRQQDHWLRDVGRLMSEIRDAEVCVQTIQQIEDAIPRGHNAAYRKIDTMLSFELENFDVAFGGWEKQAIHRVSHSGRSDGAHYHR